MATHSEKANLYPTHKCSFCGTTNNDVASIIACDGVCICDECVFVCVKILFKKDRRTRNGEKNIKS